MASARLLTGLPPATDGTLAEVSIYIRIASERGSFGPRPTRLPADPPTLHACLQPPHRTVNETHLPQPGQLQPVTASPQPQPSLRGFKCQFPAEEVRSGMVKGPPSRDDVAKAQSTSAVGPDLAHFSIRGAPHMPHTNPCFACFALLRFRRQGRGPDLTKICRKSS